MDARTARTVWVATLDGGSNPVEINIHPRDVDRAVAKWTKVTGDPGRVYVRKTASIIAGYGYNEVYGS